ncbi:hypothetical protein N3K66_000692 [Trichothecium roseum]|uniref:Uncharacterized protein n=1 Tax=Trichothecium roseum TaxID=47278 RepID=A0ACC0VFB9_9HYPO|nr:hypothetical protein N3K66_000692 [Trichothecium roseum]
MAAEVANSRYSVEDFETVSIHSAAPSYVSEVPSYHSTNPYPDALPAYTPRVRAPNANAAATGRARTQQQQEQQHQPTVGLPPVPSGPPAAAPSLNNFRLPNWSAHNNPTTRQYQNVIERRHLNTLLESRGISSSSSSLSFQRSRSNLSTDTLPPGPSRPLEDPYLVGEVAAAQARRDRITRERGDDILNREDRQWDWLLVQMRNWEERERNWARFRANAETGQRKKLLRRLGALGGRFN